MSTSLFSPLWYRVAAIKPRLRSHTSVHRHSFRGDRWYVIQDNISGRHHRITPAARYLIDNFDGDRDVQTLWEDALANLGDDAPTQEEFIQILGQLHAADLIASDVMPDNLELFERHSKQRGAQFRQRLLSPLSIRIPLFDPQRFLEKTDFLASPIFGALGLVLWLIVVVSALLQAGQHWPELSGNVVDTVLTPANLVILWLLFPLVKALHEFGHAYATRIWGGEVHEMGIMFLVFMPVPYVDASAASAFPQRYKRMVVGAAGMLVEVFLAALALHFWTLIEPGIARTLAYNIMLIGGISTLVFNANPLLRFDGYYIFSDWLEIPNLGSRANRYLGYLIQKYLFSVRGLASPVQARGEQLWFVFYSIASFIYRSMVMVVIALFVASKYFFIGVILALFAIATMFVVPTFKHLAFLFGSERLQFLRFRAVGISGTILAVLVLMLAVFPSPHWTVVEGVVWAPDDSQLRIEANCFVVETLVKPDVQVSKGEAILRCDDPELRARIAILEARIRELEVDYIQQRRVDLVAAELVSAELEVVRADLAYSRELELGLTLRSPDDGYLSVALFQDLPGKFFNKGEIIGTVVREHGLLVRVAVTQDDVALVREDTHEVELRLAHQVESIYPGEIWREVPGASHKLPSMALGSTGGGLIPVDPRGDDGVTTFQRIFQFDVRGQMAKPVTVYGGRVWVRLYHTPEPLAKQWYRSVRQLFLGAFGV